MIIINLFYCLSSSFYYSFYSLSLAIHPSIYISISISFKANDGGPSTKGSGERTFTRDSGTAVRPGGGGGGYNGGGGGARTFVPSRPSNNGGGGVPVKSWNRRNDN